MGKSRSQQIAEQNVGSRGGFVSDFFWYVAYSHIKGICTFVVEGGELHLVTGQNNQHYCGSGLFLFERFLLLSLYQVPFYTCYFASYLHRPPPSSSMHVVEHVILLLVTDIVLFQCKHEVRCEFLVPKQCPHTLYHILKIHLKTSPPTRISFCSNLGLVLGISLSIFALSSLLFLNDRLSASTTWCSSDTVREG